jgi:hypothetical protein
MFSPYFDQERPEIEIVGMIADRDCSRSYELDAAAVFKVKTTGYLVVFVSGCSCWPNRGTTTQVICKRKSDVDKALTGWSELLDDCQANKWKPASNIS